MVSSGREASSSRATSSARAGSAQTTTDGPEPESVTPTVPSGACPRSCHGHVERFVGCPDFTLQIQHQPGEIGLLLASQPRVSAPQQGVREGLAKVGSLVLFGAQPAVPKVRQHGVQEHQALDEPSHRAVVQ